MGPSEKFSVSHKRRIGEIGKPGAKLGLLSTDEIKTRNLRGSFKIEEKSKSPKMITRGWNIEVEKYFCNEQSQNWYIHKAFKKNSKSIKFKPESYLG